MPCSWLAWRSVRATGMLHCPRGWGLSLWQSRRSLSSWTAESVCFWHISWSVRLLTHCHHCTIQSCSEPSRVHLPLVCHSCHTDREIWLWSGVKAWDWRLHLGLLLPWCNVSMMLSLPLHVCLPKCKGDRLGLCLSDTGLMCYPSCCGLSHKRMHCGYGEML